MLKSLMIIIFTLVLSSCTNVGIPLDPSLTARMDNTGAQLDRAKALSIINHLRATKGVAALNINSELNNQANILAAKYAASNKAPKKPDNISAMQLSAGYADFANTFSGWRSNVSSVDILTNPKYSNAGITVVYSQNSTHGVYWVLLLD